MLAKAVLEAEDLQPLLMFSLLFPSVSQPVLAGTMKAATRLLELHFHRRRLGAASSGACLPRGAKRGPAPTLNDWSDDMCLALTRFKTQQVWQILELFGMLRPDRQPKEYQIYTSLKSYRARGEKTAHKKYLLCRADTALMVLLCHMARPGGYVNLQATFNGMPAPEMSRIVNFLLLYFIPWYDLGCDIERFVDRFEMYAEAIADKGCSLNEMHRQGPPQDRCFHRWHFLRKALVAAAVETMVLALSCCFAASCSLFFCVSILRFSSSWCAFADPSP
jgi:hypothetical protein